MAHPLNEPILNKEKTCVVNGYGILQPRITNNIECADKNIFSKMVQLLIFLRQERVPVVSVDIQL